jgi:Fe-S-cluster containining protein
MIIEAKKKRLKERKFECQRCGYCCSERAVIYPGLEEIQTLSRFLSLSESSFAIRYLHEVYDPKANAYVIAFKTNHWDDRSTGCVFCQENLCGIYNSPRTDLCNLFPWNHFDLEREEWEENFISPDNTFWCPGIGKGRLWSLEEIRKMKETYPNIGFHLKRLEHPPPLHGLNSPDVRRPSGLMLTLSEEQLLYKWRSLSMEGKRGVENFVDDLYHGGYPFH